MRYSKGADWVELDGCADLPMRELDALYTAAASEAFEVAKSVVKDWSMTAKGKAVPVGDAFGLTLKQWDWLRERIFEAARDEGLAPEA
jgi:hypothetical protein